MARSIKFPLIGGGVLALLWGGIGAAAIMGLADTPRELPAWRECIASALICLVFAYLPLYCTALFVAVILKRKKRDLAAYRTSLVPFSVPLLFAVLLTAYILLPGQK